MDTSGKDDLLQIDGVHCMSNEEPWVRRCRCACEQRWLKIAGQLKVEQGEWQKHLVSSEGETKQDGGGR